MMVSFAANVVVALCAACATPSRDSQILRLVVAPVESLQVSGDSGADPIPSSEAELRLPPRTGSDFSPSNWARPEEAARFEAHDLVTPLPVRAVRGDLLSAEVSFKASAERTGLGLDLSFTPRAHLQRNRAGSDVASTGAEVRIGPNLADRDQRGTNVAAPAWYFFVGADNEVLVWNLADKTSLNGLALRDQATVGDLQAGVAWSAGGGGQMSLGMVERKFQFNDVTGDHDVKRKDYFAAFSFTLHH